MYLREPNDERVVGDQGTGLLDRRGNQQPISRVAVFKMMQLIRAYGRMVGQRDDFDSWTIGQVFDPILNRPIQINPPDANQLRNLPCGDRAEEN